MKQEIKIYLELEVLKKLKSKAGNGRGSLSAYITKVANEDIVFLDDNAKVLLRTLDLK